MVPAKAMAIVTLSVCRSLRRDISTAEYAVFDRMMLVQNKGPIDFEKMALEWCDHVDGVKVFPELPVYLRTWYNKWQHNQEVREAVGRCVSGRGRLREINSASTDTTEMTHPLPVSSGNPPVCLTCMRL